MSLFSVKGKVAVEPFPDNAVKTASKGSGTVKVAFIENQKVLVPLKVLRATEDHRFRFGDTVYVKGTNSAQVWAKEIFEMDGARFILIPDAVIEMFDGYRIDPGLGPVK